MALVPGGGQAEQAVVHRGSVMAVPEHFSDAEAGAFPEVFLTAHLNLFMLGDLAPGRTALVHGGSGGVGTASDTDAGMIGISCSASGSGTVTGEAGITAGTAAVVSSGSCCSGGAGAGVGGPRRQATRSGWRTTTCVQRLRRASSRRSTTI